jgi:hypothetical protein
MQTRVWRIPFAPNLYAVNRRGTVESKDRESDFDSMIQYRSRRNSKAALVPDADLGMSGSPSGSTHPTWPETPIAHGALRLPGGASRDAD